VAVVVVLRVVRSTALRGVWARVDVFRPTQACTDENTERKRNEAYSHGRGVGGGSVNIVIRQQFTGALQQGEKLCVWPAPSYDAPRQECWKLREEWHEGR
jgi:hypothetical protein